MKKRILGSLLVASSVLGVSLFTGFDEASAHGYVQTPPARGYQGSLDKNSLGWTAALNLYGNVITNPQSLEAPKGFPKDGPADGRIASAEGGLGQIGDFVLDNQTSSRWKKTDISSGENTFTWHYTAVHKTSKWHYYMTKPGWDQNAPLNREELELIGTIDHDGSESSNRPSHQVTIPDNRIGYHIILAVWDVADTSNAFYNVIDVDVQNSGIPNLPSKPTNVKVTNTTKKSISLSWDAQAVASKYNIYRDGKKIKTVDTNKFEDIDVAPSTEYTYEIQAVTSMGIESVKSDKVTAKTLGENEVEKPTTPTGLHSMGTTYNSVSLMWNAATHSEGVDSYEIYRDGYLVGETKGTTYDDTSLAANTEYKYTVKAISTTGEFSEFSNVLKVKTKNETSPGEYREFKLGTLDNPELYTQGEIVSYKGDLYTTLQTHMNHGDITWSPDVAVTLFKLN